MIETLTKKSLADGRAWAKVRYTESRKRGLIPFEGYTLADETIGTDGEMACAYGLGFFYFVPTVNSYKDPDIAYNLQVRTTSYSSGRLIVKPNDNPYHMYILVTSRYFPTFNIRGYIWGYEAPSLCEKQDEHGNYWIPQSRIKPIEKIFDEPKFEINYSWEPKYNTDLMHEYAKFFTYK